MLPSDARLSEEETEYQGHTERELHEVTEHDLCEDVLGGVPRPPP